MFYDGQIDSIPSSRYGTEISVMETMHWSWAEYQDAVHNAPAELMDELLIKLQKRAQAHNHGG